MNSLCLGPNHYADMSSNLPTEFFSVSDFLQSNLLTPGRLKLPTLHAWSVDGTGVKIIICAYGGSGHIHEAFTYPVLLRSTAEEFNACNWSHFPHSMHQKQCALTRVYTGIKRCWLELIGCWMLTPRYQTWPYTYDFRVLKRFPYTCL